MTILIRLKTTGEGADTAFGITKLTTAYCSVSGLDVKPVCSVIRGYGRTRDVYFLSNN
jgi:hypothetical protein